MIRLPSHWREVAWIAALLLIGYVIAWTQEAPL